MSKINIWINGTKKEFDSFKTKNLVELISVLNLDPKFLAIALNNEVILKSDYQSTQLKENDWIEIISPQSGG